MNNELFVAFNKGRLVLVGGEAAFEQINWSKHPTFEGVELKHIVTSKDTDGKFSYHLVRIAPGKTIGTVPTRTQNDLFCLELVLVQNFLSYVIV